MWVFDREMTPALPVSIPAVLGMAPPAAKLGLDSRNPSRPSTGVTAVAPALLVVAFMLGGIVAEVARRSRPLVEHAASARAKSATVTRRARWPLMRPRTRGA